MRMRTLRGFTLIELLVVIAIIGILSAVVLASLNTARSKGQDAAIVSNINGIRTQAVIFYDTNKTYDGVCDDPTIANQRTAADNANGATNAVACYEDDVSYAASSPLVAQAGSHYCVDSTGIASTSATALGTDETVCP